MGANEARRTAGASRRAFLRRAAGLVTGAATLGAAGSARGSDPSDDGPTAAVGRRVHELRVEADALVHEERFVSDDLDRVYDERVVELDPVRLPTDAVPEAAERIDGAITHDYADAGVFGTLDEHAAAERRRIDRARARARRVRPPGPRGGGRAGPDYDGPVYQYASGTLAERKAPINLAWARSVSSSPRAVKRSMNDRGWGSLVVLSGHRYLLRSTPAGVEAVREHRHVKRQVAPWSTAQYHARLWSLPRAESDAFGVVGSAHFDPWLHGKARDAPTWRFDGARARVRSNWEVSGHDVALAPAGNGGGYGGDEFSDGRIALIGE